MARKIKEIKLDALKTALGWLQDDIEDTSIYVMRGDRLEDMKEDKPIVCGVNWSAKGTCTASDTEQFAKNLMKSVKICEVINSLQLSNVTLDDDTNYSPMQFHKECEIIKALLLLGEIDYIEAWIEHAVE